MLSNMTNNIKIVTNVPAHGFSQKPAYSPVKTFEFGEKTAFLSSNCRTRVRQAKADGTYSKLLIYLAKQDLLILDDWGLEPLDTAQRNDVMEIMDDRNDARSTIIISQLPVDQWHQSIGDNTLADAILDRLVHNAHRMPLKGASLRQLQPES